MSAIGLDMVRQTDKSVNGIPLISTTKGGKYKQHRVGTCFIMTHSSTHAKKQQVLDIEKNLGIQLHMEIVK